MSSTHTTTFTSSITTTASSSSTASVTATVGNLNVKLKLVTYKSANVLVQVCTTPSCSTVLASSSPTVSPASRTSTSSFSLPTATYYIRISGNNIATQQQTVTTSGTPQTITFTIF
jgi:hypothetical protein